MAGGWARDGAVQDQIDASVEDAVALARSRLNAGASVAESLTHCEECDNPIPEKRREAIPGIRLCIKCQAEAEKQQLSSGSINRRGSKDSQLR
ncbi:DksA/TraR family C4-type zinc finger protein [Amphritea atlantica]|uniref:DksA/TraR family C4-type zinc finger protein n=1 Tax=Amphritea atlantica TaxID=355243 RepID=A0ABY5GPN6_9GAMM|nr:DksA/TraR family C4-type zinc finger protein [Amphritea atlantica]